MHFGKCLVCCRCLEIVRSVESRLGIDMGGIYVHEHFT